MSDSLVIESVLSYPFEEMTYILHRGPGTDCVVVDPGLEPDKIFEALDRNNLSVVTILNTHGHADHIGGNEEMKNRYPDAPLIIGAGDVPMLSDPMLNLSGYFGVPLTSPPADRTVQEGDTLELLGTKWRVRDLPGHSPGHVVFIWEEGTPPIVLGGDVLMAGSIGRTDFPGGDLKQLLTGIHEKLYTLPESTIVYPGHGPPTTVGREKATNPFTSDRFLFR